MDAPYFLGVGFKYPTEIVSEKRRYFEKVLSESAIWNNYQRALDTEDYFAEWSWSETMYFIWLNISSLFIFGLEPYELEPWDPEFNIKIPSLEEWLQGVKIKIEPKTVGEAYGEFWKDYFNIEIPPILDFDTFVEDNVKPEYAEDIRRRKAGKLVVGESKYGEAYVDPPVIRDLIRSTLYELARRRMDFNRIREIYRIAVDRGLITEGMAESIFNRLVIHFQPLFETLILDYNLLNYSKLARRGSHSATFPVITWRGEEHDVEFTKFDELNCGLILNVTPLNLGLLLPRELIFKPGPRALAVTGTPPAAWFIDWKVRQQIYRYRATGVGFGNYQRPDETTAYYRSERADQYHLLRLFFYHLDSLVDAILEGEDVDVFRLNLYRRAAAMLIGHKKKRHRWGYAAFRDMTEEEFKQWWLDYWAKQGLNTSLLEKIYERVGKWLPSLRSGLEELGERVRRRRLQLAQALL